VRVPTPGRPAYAAPTGGSGSEDPAHTLQHSSSRRAGAAGMGFRAAERIHIPGLRCDPGRRASLRSPYPGLMMIRPATRLAPCALSCSLPRGPRQERNALAGGILGVFPATRRAKVPGSRREAAETGHAPLRKVPSGYEPEGAQCVSGARTLKPRRTRRCAGAAVSPRARSRPRPPRRAPVGR